MSEKLALTIIVPVVYMARDIMILMWANSFQGPLEGVGPEKQDFFGAQMAHASLEIFRAPPSNVVATLRRCTQRKRYRMCMYAHNVSKRNIKVSKRERHITYSVTKHTSVL